MARVALPATAFSLQPTGRITSCRSLAAGHMLPPTFRILCAPCNLHKSNRDPIDHMRSLGRLL